MVSLANILLSVSTELVMVPTAYLTLAPMRYSEWISGKAFAFLMALSVVGGVGCGVVYALVPSVRVALFVSSSLVSLLILVRVSRIRLRSILYIFFTAEFFICSVRILAGIASFCLRPSSYQGGVPSWEAHVIMWALLVLFTLVFRPVFIERISFIIENCESGRAPDTLWRFGWLLPFSCYLVVVLALDTAPDQIASASQLALALFLQVSSSLPPRPLKPSMTSWIRCRRNSGVQAITTTLRMCIARFKPIQAQFSLRKSSGFRSLKATRT